MCIYSAVAVFIFLQRVIGITVFGFSLFLFHSDSKFSVEELINWVNCDTMTTSVKKTYWFAIVKFVVTEEVEAVPLSWIRSCDEKVLCAWPPNASAAKVSKAVLTMHPPEDHWEEYEAVVIRKAG